MVKSFHEGTDTAVVSLRDDVENVRTSEGCKTDVLNKLFEAGDPTVMADSTAKGWARVGCKLDAQGRAIGTCVAAVPIQTGGSSPLGGGDLSQAHGYTIQFGDGGSTNCTTQSRVASRRRPPSWRMTLPPGVHRLSWYGRPIDLFGRRLMWGAPSLVDMLRGSDG
jgi:hypothetical protein